MGIEQLSAVAAVGKVRLNGEEDVEMGVQGTAGVRRDLDVERRRRSERGSSSGT